MRVLLALTLAVVLALPGGLAAGGASEEAQRKAVSLMRASDRDEAALETALVTALADRAKLPGPGPDATQQELKRLLTALRALRSEKAGILDALARANQGKSEGERLVEEAKRAEEIDRHAGALLVFQQVIIAVCIAIINAVIATSSGADTLLAPVLTSVVALTATHQASLSEFSRAAGLDGKNKAVVSALAATNQANAAARQAQARLQAARRLQTPTAAAPKPLSNPLLPSLTPKSPPR